MRARASADVNGARFRSCNARTHPRDCPLPRTPTFRHRNRPQTRLCRQLHTFDDLKDCILSYSAEMGPFPLWSLPARRSVAVSHLAAPHMPVPPPARQLVEVSRAKASDRDGYGA